MIAKEEDNLISIVAPFHNEEELIALFLSRIISVIGTIDLRDYSFQIILVDDGSSDLSVSRIEEYLHLTRLPISIKEVSLVQFSRNFGKESALTAGLRTAKGSATIIIDTDLQDPPELIPRLIEKWREGYEMVVPVRSGRNGERLIRRFLSERFYRVFSFLCSVVIRDGAGDFRLLDRSVNEAINSLPENARFMKGLYSWVGYKGTYFIYDRATRHSGESRFSLMSLFRLAAIGIISFSAAPLYLMFIFGLAISLLGFFFCLYVVITSLVHGNAVAGYTSLASFIIFFGGINLLFMGIIGIYLSQIFTEVKRRPSYLISKQIVLHEELGS